MSVCTQALTELGFQVQDSDSLPQHRAAKQEDLRVTVDELVVLAEIKGYGKGAKANDLEQLKKAATVYALNEHLEPDRLWYIVNAYRESHPSDRPKLLESNSEQVEAFATLFNGLVIDSTDLYCLLRDVQLGRLSSEKARALLLSARGHFSYPAVEHN